MRWEVTYVYNYPQLTSNTNRSVGFTSTLRLQHRMHSYHYHHYNYYYRLCLYTETVQLKNAKKSDDLRTGHAPTVFTKPITNINV